MIDDNHGEGAGPLGPPPETPDALHELLARVWGLRVARHAMHDARNGPFEYLTHTFFEGAHSTGPRDCVVWAARGTGKTFLGAVATALDLVFKPGIEIRILGGSLEQSRRMHTHLRRLFEHDLTRSMIAGRVTERRLALTNGSCVELLAQSQTSVRGTRVQKLRCDEVELFDPDVWEAAQLTTRSGTFGGFFVPGTIECLSTMHRSYGLMHQLVDQARDRKRTLFTWNAMDVLEHCTDEYVCGTPGENPCALLDECGGLAKLRAHDDGGHLMIADALRMKSRVSGEAWASEMLCRRPSRSDAVLPEFDAGAHVVSHTPTEGDEGVWWCMGMDFGVRSPTVMLFAAVDARGVVWIVDERSETDVTLGDHARAIRESPWPEPRWIGVDPAGHQRSLQTGSSDIAALRREGFGIRSRRLGVQEGLALVRARMAPADGSGPRLFVHKRCTGLIRSMLGYHYPAGRPWALDPVKDGPDHAVDALRYLIVNLDRPSGCSSTQYL